MYLICIEMLVESQYLCICGTWNIIIIWTSYIVGHKQRGKLVYIICNLQPSAAMLMWFSLRVCLTGGVGFIIASRCTVRRTVIENGLKARYVCRWFTKTWQIGSPIHN